ncbi:MAG: hypothetical protein ACC662_04385, partial [Planctomycetota bacterium]
EREGLRESAKTGTLTSPYDLVRLRKDQFFENKNREKQAAAFIRFLLEAKSKKTRRVFEDYVRNLQDVVAEEQAKQRAKREAARAKGSSGGQDDAPKTEEEEDEAFRKRQQAWKEKEEEFLQEVFVRTFGDWKEKDWKRLQKLYFACAS